VERLIQRLKLDPNLKGVARMPFRMSRSKGQHIVEFGLELISEAPVVAQIESQGKLKLTFDPETNASPNE